jgi:hypothetical protein
MSRLLGREIFGNARFHIPHLFLAFVGEYQGKCPDPQGGGDEEIKVHAIDSSVKEWARDYEMRSVERLDRGFSACDWGMYAGYPVLRDVVPGLCCCWLLAANGGGAELCDGRVDSGGDQQ